MTRLILAASLLSALVGVLLTGLSLTLEFRSRMLYEVDAAIAKRYESLSDALNSDIHSVVQINAQQIAQDTHALAVKVFDDQGAEFATIEQPEAAADALDHSMPRWQQVAAGFLPAIPLPDLDVTRSIDINGDVVGSISVALSSRPLIQVLARYIAMATLAVMLVTALALYLTKRMRRDILDPITRLLDAMDTVVRTKNFELRATPEGPDEIGSLTISFNELLKQIHTRNQTLTVHRKQLQELVIERTKSFEKAAREAEIASRAKGDFLARMSHEIRTPMNGVLGMAELLENTRLEDQQHNMLKTMRTSADSLLDIINDILDFSRIEAGQLQVLATAFSPVDLIEEVCELLAPRAHERDLELICDIDGRMPEACGGDPLRLRQIVTNLLGNAIKYTPKGSVTLRAAAHPDGDDRILLHVEVEDTGMGIPEDQLQKMFEPFTQGESFESRKQGGTGLGLAITKQLVTLLDGEISVTSKLGSGSKFWFDVPLKVEKKAAPPEARWQSGAKNVLVLQGEWSGARVVARMLEEAGSEVTTLREAYTALDTLVTENFDLIVVDEILPDMNGYEFIERLRSSDKSKTMGIVLMTSTRPAAVKLDRVSAADARVSRPVRRSRLREAVDQALGRAPAPAPVADEPATGVPAQKAAEHGGASKTAEKPHRGLRVLLVEDSPVNREVATGMLESLGCIVDTASDGNVGLEEALSWRFDVILMDCQMPRMDGFEATSRIRKAEAAVGRAGMPIIAVTANALQGDRERCLAAGMTDFVSKPYTIKKLSDALTAAKTGKTNFEVPPPNPRIKSAVQKDLPVVDSSHIDELRSIGKPGLLEGAIELFHKQAGAVLGEIDAALRGDDAALAEARFHALKSCSLSVGARRFADLAGQCELAARKGDLAAARALSAGLRPEYATLSEALVAVSQEIRLAI